MKIALFLSDEKLKAIHVDAIAILLIEMYDDSIKSIEKDSLYSKNLNYISLWLVKKQIDVVYLQNADECVRDYFKRINVEVKTFKDLKENPVLSLLLL